MKITLEQPKLAALINRVASIPEKRNVIPILSNVLLSTDDGKLKATATDMDILVSSVSECVVHQHGSTTVNVAMLGAIVNKMAKGAVITISADDNAVTVSNGRAEFTLSSLPVEDFPELASDTFQSEFEISGDDLSRLFDLAAFAMSSEEVRYYLQGIYLHPHGGNVRAVSTDGHRLAQIDSDVEADFPGVIVPRKVVSEIRKLLSDSDDVTVKISETKTQFIIGGTTVLSKVIDGTFPDYTRVIPRGNTHTVTVDAASMKGASDLVALVSNERTKSVRLDMKGDTCELSVNTGQDKAVEYVTIDKDGDDCVIGFSAKYLSEAMMQCNGSEITMRFSNNAPVVIQPNDDDKALYVVMPMRVS